jgi:hypothetical protein
MKNIIKSICSAIILTGVISCEDTRDPIVSPNGFELRKDATVTSPSVLTQATATDIFAKFEWDSANNGPATVSTYTLQVFDHNDTTLSNPVEYTGNGLVITPTSRKASLTVAEFNTLLNRLPTFKCSEMDVDIRIKSVLGINPNPYIQYSNPINVKVTAYSLKLPVMAFVKDGNDASAEPRIAASAPLSNSDYEGYMYLEAGAYKFYQPDACYDFTSPIIYGGDVSIIPPNQAVPGKTSGVLNTGSSVTSISISTAGYYLLTVDLSTNTFAIKLITTFGIFGTATRSGLGTGFQVPFDYDAATKTWSKEMDLIKGNKFKFKSNFWTGTLVVPPLPNPPYAPGTTTTTNLTVQFPTAIVSILGKTAIPFGLQENSTAGQGDITVPGTNDGTRDKYKIILDVSKPRNYTYKLTKVTN